MAEWKVERQVVNTETQLSKVTAVRTDGTESKSFQVKARLGTSEEKKDAWDDIWRQYQDSVKVVTDTVAGEAESYLDGKEGT